MKIKKAILTGGGRATRLHPITTTINKHLLPLANKPMIFHAIDKAVEAGITQIFINTNPGETELQRAIGDGGHWGISITFYEQRGGPQGVAHIANEAKEFIGNDPFLFYLSDNILLGNLKDMIEEFHANAYDCMLALSKVPDPRGLGVPVFSSDGKTLVDVLEKPEHPPNNFGVTGIYLYAPNVFFNTFNRIDKSARGEYEISSIHSLLLKDRKRVGYKEITGWWKDTGKPEDLLIANQLLLDLLPETELPNHGTIDSSARISGKVKIGLGSRILPNTVITGPVIIGENCLIENAIIGPHVTIGQGADIKNAHIQNSIILDNATINMDMMIYDSILGKGVQLKKRPKGTTPEGHKMIIGDKTIIEL